MHPVWILFLFAVGACVGSFLNVVSYRLPRGESIVFPASHCPRCGVTIKWYDNIPLVSWFVLRGRCRRCKGPISPRYLLIEFLTAVLVSGMYVCYFVLKLRTPLDPMGQAVPGALEFGMAWPMFLAHTALLCGLLAASVVDVKFFIVPLPVMWVCAAIGIGAVAFRPHPFMPVVSAATAAASLAAILGLIVARILLHFGWIRPSFLDAEDRPLPVDSAGGKDGQDRGVAITSASGVNPRTEILRELLFLTPAIVLALAAYLAATRIGPVGQFLDGLLGPRAAGPLAAHLASGAGAIFGMLVGAAWIWGTRIVGTLAFGKEAMGMGDVHILGAVGAVAGWKVASLTFFAAPVFGLIWALYLLTVKGKRELPYGPWLALGALVVLLFYDGIVALIFPAAWP